MHRYHGDCAVSIETPSPCGNLAPIDHDVVKGKSEPGEVRALVVSLCTDSPHLWCCHVCFPSQHTYSTGIQSRLIGSKSALESCVNELTDPTARSITWVAGWCRMRMGLAHFGKAITQVSRIQLITGRNEMKSVTRWIPLSACWVRGL